ncbi:hypothetical protein NBE98_07190 [Clostridium swellfunianum]|uniref:hypothetical protein n=1 Tax=Clostridium swellfunianum TaxID=1367462 RepID=UPI0020301BFB|nr:hypothetical protein [Clostridium swellfunianum]MCM0648159.1 hypothetical protein [Clostridium swellfunianum]
MKDIFEGGNRIPIEVLLNCATNEYLSSDKSQLKKLKKVSFIKKLRNKRALKGLSQKLMQDLEPYRAELQEKLNSKPDFSSPEMQRVKSIVTGFMLEVDKRKLVFDRPFLNFFIEQGYLEVAQEFITRARDEDSELKFEEIFQAMRNVWIMNSLQLFWGLPLELTPSVYAYSMLYPYTDNFLDNPQVNSEDKIKFNERLSKVLNGEKLTPANVIEEKVFSLVGKIESQYSRDGFPEVFHSLRLIQEAQTESIKQDKDELLAYDKILPISFFKGGTSVLADAFLVKGKLNIKEMHFTFAYGSFLQLLDDLQDTVVDKKDNHQTLFSTRSNYEVVDNEVRRLVSFIFKANSTDESDTPIMSLMKEVITSCTLVMIMEAAGRNPSLISHRLYKELEAYSKVKLSFYKEFEDKLKSLVK